MPIASHCQMSTMAPGHWLAASRSRRGTPASPGRAGRLRSPSPCPGSERISTRLSFSSTKYGPSVCAGVTTQAGTQCGSPGKAATVRSNRRLRPHVATPPRRRRRRRAGRGLPAASGFDQPACHRCPWTHSSVLEVATATDANSDVPRSGVVNVKGASGATASLHPCTLCTLAPFLMESLVLRGIPVIVENTRPDIATADVVARLDEALALIERLPAVAPASPPPRPRRDPRRSIPLPWGVDSRTRARASPS